MIREYTGHQPSTLAVQRAGVALGRTDHVLGAHGPVSGGHAPGRDRGGGRLLVERDPAAYDGVGEAAHQPGRDGSPRSPGCTSHPGRGWRPARRSPRRRRAAARRPRRAPRHARRPPRPWPGPTATGSGPATIVPPLAACASMPSSCGGPQHLVDAAAHRGVLGEGAGPAGALRHGRERGGEQRRAPAAVAAARAEPGRLGLDDGDPQGRLGAGEVQRRPQAGEAGTDDRHVGLAVAGQRGPRGPVVRGGLVPEAR